MRPVILGLTCLGVLAACGGGGGGGAAEPPKSFRLTVTADDNSIFNNPTEFETVPGATTTISVSAVDAAGQAVPNGTDVRLTTTMGCFPTEDGCVSSVQLESSGGRVTHPFRAGSATGNATITATVFDANANRNVSSSTTVSISENPDPGPLGRVTLEATRTDIPANAFGVPPFLGSPFSAAVTITYRDESGNLSAPAGGEVGVSIDPVTRGAFATLDDPATEENELEQLIGNGPVELAGGTAQVFVHSFDEPGTLRLRATAQDPETGATFDDELIFNIVEPAADGAPANVSVVPESGIMYIQGSGGRTNQQIQVQVVDGATQPVADSDGGNNVLLELLTPNANSGEQLSAINASGVQVTGTSIAVATTAGITSANLRAGTESGFVTVRATADAADNNVDNGIQVPIVDEFQIDVSDGIPFAITLATVPSGPAFGGVTVTSPTPNAPFPLTGNDVFTMQIEALITDRRGNPPATPVTVNFGLIDFPTTDFPTDGPGFFAISGPDGDPQEGGDDFFAPTGEFQTAGGGAGPGDTLVLFGREVVGNADHESARIVEQVLSQTRLTVERDFNLNRTTGMSVDSGPVIPYAIGRAMFGSIDTGAVTNEFGVATTFLNYPVSSIGRSLIIYAQGTNGSLGGNEVFHTFADVVSTVYPASGPLTLTAAPATIPGNTTQTVSVCAIDSAGIPVPGLVVGFSFSNASGTATVDGQPQSGTVANPTGFDGCTLATVTTSGVPAGSEGFNLTFEAGGASAVVEILVSADALLTVQPSTIIGNNLNGREVALRYLTGNGEGIAGVQITGVCESDQGAINFREEPGVTDANGETTAVVTVQGLDAICPDEEPGEGTCTFTTATGNPETVLTIRGREANILASPEPATCETDGDAGGTLSVAFSEDTVGGNNALPGAMTAQILADDGQINCEYALGGTAVADQMDCSEAYTSNVSRTLTLSYENLPMGETALDQRCSVNGDQPGCFVGWQGACSAFGNNISANVTVDADKTCIARFR